MGGTNPSRWQVQSMRLMRGAPTAIRWRSQTTPDQATPPDTSATPVESDQSRVTLTGLVGGGAVGYASLISALPASLSTEAVRRRLWSGLTNWTPTSGTCLAISII